SLAESTLIGAYPVAFARAARRKRLLADTRWQAFLPKIRDLIEVAENKIMKPANFYPRSEAH
ncbi:NIPSNAP family protein, partial [Rhizobium ruizarguesonis]